jgi:hypothetical protein
MRTVWGDHQRFFDTYFSAYPGKILLATAAAATRTATTGSPVGSTTSSMSRATAWAPLRSRAPSYSTAPSPSPSPRRPWSATPRRQGPRHLRLCHPERRRRTAQRPETGAGRPRPQGDRPDRGTGRDPLGTGTAQDPVGEDHAADIEEDRGGGCGGAGRHLDAGGSGGGGGVGGGAAALEHFPINLDHAPRQRSIWHIYAVRASVEPCLTTLEKFGAALFVRLRQPFFSVIRRRTKTATVSRGLSP